MLLGHELTSELRCPLSGKLFEDPVLTTEGNTYERREIAKWFEENNTDPVSGAVLESKLLIVNTTVRRAVEQLRAARRAAQSSGISSGDETRPSEADHVYPLYSASMRGTAISAASATSRLGRESSFTSSAGSSTAGSSAPSSTAFPEASVAKAQLELAEMKKKLGMFMLGGDTAGGQAGTHSALTLSNAITNLSVGCWSQVGARASGVEVSGRRRG